MLEPDGLLEPDGSLEPDGLFGFDGSFGSGGVTVLFSFFSSFVSACSIAAAIASTSDCSVIFLFLTTAAIALSTPVKSL